MQEMTVRFKWDDKKLGKDWFNKFNLGVLLYSDFDTRKDLLEFEVIEDVRESK